jgi:UDP-N-acetylmuramoylalanine--D-glutamate ligase
LMQIRKATIRESLSNFQGVEHRLEKYWKFKMFNISMIQKQQMLPTFFCFSMNNNQQYGLWVVLIKGMIIMNWCHCEKVKAIICLGVDNKRLCFGNVVDIWFEVHNEWCSWKWHND